MPLPLVGVERPLSVDYDPLDQFVYFTDILARSLSRIKLDGTDQELLIDDMVIGLFQMRIYSITIETVQYHGRLCIVGASGGIGVYGEIRLHKGRGTHIETHGYIRSRPPSPQP